MKNFIRRKTIFCGKNKNYIEVDIFPCTDAVHNVPRKRRYRESLPQQRALNDKNAKRRFVQLVCSNIEERDFFVTLTYDDVSRPPDVATAEQNLRGFIRRLRRKSKGQKGKVVYLAVTEESKNGKLHHHLCLKRCCNLSRDEIEGCWSAAGRELLGMVNCVSIQYTGNRDVAGLAKYMTKNMKGRRRWMGSRNLTKPVVSIADGAVSVKEWQEMNLFRETGTEVRQRFEDKYPGYDCIGFENYFNPETGQDYIRVVLRRRRKRG